ncbi:hypothetical protein [Homoserinibacter sp. GY 40078]|uniref:hypothetical protein n=1 Tax=Homoserinibacter sp. GY 40078 TaxID=2603275 RepID=UPI0011C9E0A4|nr:hypothetical protein [Homoserinibacter sp. GY 40078]TXK18401.1 hypothetical protein FVQ89_00065 [Homoserinibacter sp. GY 40078]
MSESTSYFRVSEGRGRGLTASQLRRLDAPFWGVRSSWRDTGFEHLVRAFAPRMPDRAFFYGTTAARLHELPLPERMLDDAIHVAVPAGSRRVDAQGVRAHHVRISPLDITSRGWCSLASVARTWCDLGAMGATEGDLVVSGDRALWVRDPLTTTELLAETLSRYEGRRGARRLHEALPLLDSRADSPAESRIRLAIHHARLPRPAVNTAVRVGSEVIHPDLVWAQSRVMLEYEGDHHRTDRRQWRYDIRRYANARAAGWVVIQATGDDLRDPSRLLAALRRALTP